MTTKTSNSNYDFLKPTLTSAEPVFTLYHSLEGTVTLLPLEAK